MVDIEHGKGWPKSLGVLDSASGAAKARESRERLLGVAREMFRDRIVMQEASLLTRVQSLHEGAVQACEATNPHATFTLLRALVEQCAAIEFAIDKPAAAEALWQHDGHGVTIGRLINHAKRSGRTENFGRIYADLSQYAHPGAMAHWAGWRVEDDAEGTMSWSSAPRFKFEEDELAAWGWIVELTDMSADLLRIYSSRPNG